MAPYRFLLVLLLGSQLLAADKPPIEFPEVEGWHRGTRWDQPKPQNTNIIYKAKLSKTWLPTEINVFGQDDGGAPDKLDADATVKTLEKLIQKQLDSPIEKDAKATKPEQVSLGGKDAPKAWLVRFTSKRGGDPWEKQLYLTLDRGYYVCIVIGERPPFMKEGQPQIARLIEAMGKAVKAK